MSNNQEKYVFMCHESITTKDSLHHDTHKVSHKSNVPKNSKKSSLKLKTIVGELGFKLFWENLDLIEVKS